MAMDTNFTSNPFADPNATPQADMNAGKKKAVKNPEQQALVEAGKLALQNMTEEEKSKLGSASGDLVFMYMLGNPNKKATRRVGIERNPDGTPKLDAAQNRINKDEECSDPVGFVFKAMKEVTVPVISAALTTQTGFTSEDVTYKTYPAGSEIIFTYLELFVLGCQEEYSLKFGAEVTDEAGNKTIDPKGFRLDIKMATYLNKDKEKKVALPSPSPALESGAVKAHMVDICKKNEKDPVTGMPVWTKAEYGEKFGILFARKNRTSVSRAGGEAAPKPDKANVMAAICRNILSDMQKRKG